MELYRKKALIEVVDVFNDGDRLVQNQGDDSDQWVIPKDVFESTYEKVE
jgi:hypothetical protein